MPQPPNDPAAADFLRYGTRAKGRNVAYQASTKARSVSTYNRFATFLADRGRTIVTATRADCHDYIQSRISAGLADNTVYSEHRHLSSLYRWLLDDGQLPKAKRNQHDHPMMGVPGPASRETDASREVVDESTYRALLATCDQRTEQGLRDATILSLLYWSGPRRGELVEVDVDSVDFRSVPVRIMIGDELYNPKGDAASIPVAAETEQLLSRYLRKRGDQSGPLFLSQHERRSAPPGAALEARRMDGDAIARMLRRRAVAAGIDPNLCGAHRFRRAMAIRLKMAGADDSMVMAIGRWTQSDMVRRYTRAAEEKIAHASFVELDTSLQRSRRANGARLKRVS